MTATAVVLKRKPTKAICVDECGAQCCRAPGHFSLDHLELDRLNRLGAQLGVAVRIFRRTSKPFVGNYVLDFSNNGGACPFLDRDSSLCRIYDERPRACRHYPTEPDDRCILWGDG
jgi:Fe-S-cluster containining protein